MPVLLQVTDRIDELILGQHVDVKTARMYITGLVCKLVGTSPVNFCHGRRACCKVALACLAPGVCLLGGQSPPVASQQMHWVEQG